MDTNKLKELIEKVKSNTISDKEKLELIQGLNVQIKEYNKVLKEALEATK